MSCVSSPRSNAAATSGLRRHVRPTSRWGSFERLVPASFAPVDVSQLPRNEIPANIKKPSYADTRGGSDWDSGEISFVQSDDLPAFERACKLAAEILQQGGKLCQEGVTTEHIDKVLHDAIISRNAYPSPLNYMGFPKSVCTSVNNVIAHGIPDDRPLQNGDIVNIDVTVFLDGFHGDTSATFMVGDVDECGKTLVQVTNECLDQAIKICGPDVPFQEIGRIISTHAANNGFTVSSELSGHGIGRQFHSLPLIYHHVNQEPGEMKEGMAFTIEPILCQGSPMGIMWPDQWTISTVDGGRSAQAEHTIIITDTGARILTL
ncbi:hypothetical protein VTP01DRAFT_2533 [Rhizomucor pusillus]|uniref:uncharacterized protein n=1 Tax=Rhizomucor pusillus TaxID=4840 RepID=UPI003744601A